MGQDANIKKREKSHFKSKKCEKFHIFESKNVIVSKK